MSRRRIAALVSVLAVVALAPSFASAADFVAATWGDNSVHLLDAGLNDTGSFSVGAGAASPNGIATDGSLIWSGHFSTSEIIAYDFSGTEQFRFAGPSGLQGLEYMDSTELAAMNAAGTMIEFYNPLSGAFVRDFAAQASNVEGIAWDGTYLWQLQSSLIYATSKIDGTVAFSIPNAAAGESFGGTAITNYTADSLILGSAGGNWYEVSKADGSIITSGNNGLEMFGLKMVPEPASLALMALGALAIRRRG